MLDAVADRIEGEGFGVAAQYTTGIGDGLREPKFVVVAEAARTVPVTPSTVSLRVRAVSSWRLP